MNKKGISSEYLWGYINNNDSYNVRSQYTKLQILRKYRCEKNSSLITTMIFEIQINKNLNNEACIPRSCTSSFKDCKNGGNNLAT